MASVKSLGDLKVIPLTQRLGIQQGQACCDYEVTSTSFHWLLHAATLSAPQLQDYKKMSSGIKSDEVCPPPLILRTC